MSTLFTTCSHNSSGQNSVLNSINTGFGPENSLSFTHHCDTPTVLHLYKETYLSEFETEEEKSLVRLNLGVPSIREVESAISLKLKDFATKQDVDRIIAGSVDLQNYYTKAETEDKLKNIKLNLDTTPTKNSQNGVTSGGVWKHIDDTVGEIHRYAQTI